MYFDLEVFTSALITLLVIMDPPGTVPVFLSLTGRKPPAARAKAARQAVLISLLVITLFAVAGQVILAYLGIGVVGIPSWGQTVDAAVPFFDTYPLFLYAPVVGITVLVIALNLLGDAVRDAFDPKTRR